MTHLTDADIALFAKIPRSVLDDVIKATVRLPQEWWGDLVGDLELAEKRNTPGKIIQEMHHDGRGVVRKVYSETKRERQGGRKAS